MIFIKTLNEFLFENTQKSNIYQVYHGTNDIFDVFEYDKIGSNTKASWNGAGFYFSDNKAEASLYGNKILKVEIKLNNPIDLTEIEDTSVQGSGFIRFFNKLDCFKNVPIYSCNKKTISELYEIVDKLENEFDYNNISFSEGSNEHFKHVWYKEYVIRNKTLNEINNKMHLKSSIISNILYEKYNLSGLPIRVNELMNAQSFTKIAKENGYDGVINFNSTTTTGKEYVVFDNKNIIIIEKLNESIKFNLNSVGREDWDLYLTNNTTKQFIVYLSPDEFLNRVKHDSFSIEPNKIDKYSDSIKNSNSEIPVPCMWFTNQYQYENGYRPEFHDGQHRVLALKQLGIKSIPIKIIIDIETKNINEFLDTEKLKTGIKFITKTISQRIQNIGLSIYDIKSTQKSDVESLGFYTYSFRFDMNSNYNSDIKKVSKILDIFKLKLIRTDNLVMSYEVFEGTSSVVYNLYFKNLISKRIKTPKFVYHQTRKEKVDYILKNGLELSPSKNWDKSLEYPDSIFCTSDKEHLFYPKNRVLLKIDTSMIPNKWFKDLNIDDEPSFIMTFEAIPPEAIMVWFYEDEDVDVDED